MPTRCLQVCSVVKLQICTYRKQANQRKRGQNMQPNEYLDAAKARLNIQSDYELAKRFGVPNGNIAGIRTGHRKMALDVAFKVAITLEIDPAQVVADLESQREKNPARKGFWSSFISRAATVAVLVCTLALSFSATFGNAQTRAMALFNRRFGFA